MVDNSIATATGLAARGGRTRYDSFSIALHWITAILVVLQFGLAETWGFAERPTRQLMVTSHMSFGILLSVVIVVRLIWRLVPGHRVRPTHSGIVQLAASAVHGLLYVLLVVEAVLGYVFRWSGNESMKFFGLLIPPPFAPFSRTAHHYVAETHEWIGWAIIVIAAGHAAAALFHHYVLKDGELSKMLPGHGARNDA